jgi:hypothetical protein
MKNRNWSGFFSAHRIATAMIVPAALLAARAENIVLHTGGATTPITDWRVLEAASGPNAWVEFNFGFATAEELLAGSFFDAVTFSLQGSVPSATTTIVTLDRTGALFAPITPGGITLERPSIAWQEIAFPADLNPELAYRRAFTVSAPIPQELLGQPLTFFVDLFDNQNGVASVAYSTAPTVIPEPSALLLAFVGTFFVFGLKWRNK